MCGQQFGTATGRRLGLVPNSLPVGYQEGGSMDPVDSDGNYILSDVDYLETYRALEDSVKAGKVRSIGVSNFSREQTQCVIDNCTIKPVINQVEMNPYLSQLKLKKFCEGHGISLTGYAALTSPNQTYYRSDQDPTVLNDPVVIKIAKEINKSVGQVVLRWAVQRGIIVVPNSKNPARMAQNLDVFSFELSSDHMQSIDNLDRNHRMLTYSHLRNHKQYPFHEEY